MNWNFFKTNWFYFAMGVVFLLYTVRKYPWLNPLNSNGKNTKTEKFTEAESSPKKGAALLGLVPDASSEKRLDAEPANGQKAEAFLKRFAPVAVSERKKFGVPASVILACAYVNSEAGQSESATAANNFFALPCADAWDGETEQIEGDCFRKYESAWASFRDFSIHLSSQEWYGSLKKSAGKDWEKWVEKLGSEDVSNGKSMKKIIEAYKLHELD